MKGLLGLRPGYIRPEGSLKLYLRYNRKVRADELLARKLSPVYTARSDVQST